MKEYKKLVETVLTEGQYKENRTGVDTISYFGYSYKIDTGDRFPLLTTKKMDGYRWDSMIHELFWYLSGEEHIRNLREETKIWDAWAGDGGHLDTAYGRFWRQYPCVDPLQQLEGETWAERNDSGRNDEFTFDQIQYVIDELQENPHSRRLVVNAWHPVNATVSTLPPCHYTFVFNVQGNRLNLHLTQRSGDVALGVPFNIACYGLLQRMIAQEVGLEVGEFHHTIVDAHIYCGEGERGKWWKDNLEQYQEGFVFEDEEFTDIDIACIKNEAPHDPDNLDHVPGLLKQIQRKPKKLPIVEIADKPFDDLGYDDIELKEYESHGGIKFGVAT